MSGLEWATWVGSIGTCVAGIVVAVTLIFLYRQNKTLSEQNKTLQRSVHSATYQSLQQNEAAYHALLINHPEVNRVIYKEDYEGDTSEDLGWVKAYWTALLVLTFMENLCVQYKDFGLIPDRLWSTWEAYMRHDLGRYSFLQEVYEDYKEMFAYVGEYIPRKGAEI